MIGAAMECGWMPSGHPIFAALYGGLAEAIERGPVGAARRELVARAHGVVVDLGAGIGLNLTHLGPSVTRVHLVEPDPHMIRRLPSDRPANVEVHQVGAERLPLRDASVDTVLATLTLCTVSDVLAAAAEMRRVLRPDGQVLVLEHVRSLNPALARWQDWLSRPWGWASGGCHPNRDTGATLAEAGFDTSGLTRLDVPGMTLAREWLTGRALARNRAGR